MKLKPEQIATFRQLILSKKQDGRCAICRINIHKEEKVPALDHDHTTGMIRGVLCNNCNGIEGKVHNLARRAKRDGTPEWWLTRLLEYWKHHKDNPSQVFHPIHKTKDEKRVLKNKRARLKRRRAKRS